MTSNYHIESKSTKIFLAELCLIQHFMGMESMLVIPAGTQVILSSDGYLEAAVEWGVVSHNFPCFSSSLSLFAGLTCLILDSVSFSIILEMLNSYYTKSPNKLNSFLLPFFFFLF